MEDTEAEAKGLLHSVNRGLTSPWRAFDRFNSRNAERLQPRNQEEALLSAGYVPANTAALQQRKS